MEKISDACLSSSTEDGQQRCAVGDPREDEILRAAFEEFTERGFHGATMLAVAGRARASKATLYEKFHNKVGLFHALLEWGCRQTMADLRSIVDDVGRDPKDALADCAARVLMAMGSPPALALLRISIAEGARRPEVGTIYNSLTRDPIVAFIRQLVERLVASEAIVIREPEEFGAAFIGLLRGDLFYQALLGTATPTPEDWERLARRAVARLLRAFAP
ncbi:TetR/AcrR family transcriptional regulator [Telmatospirillum sp.]|uniref:TetR/AcrR family transcriptional regulator n=1 Tax=Telmatospirillum sp. TaxID=2079197 RepID=UPI0028471C3B|nr:TetR/AcrR family transcriptional regulator [Telmatospirillum sp.]MDR3439417.1 TetR/AcrR family transcriptional regulator [Telmatospirillum sp.]